MGPLEQLSLGREHVHIERESKWKKGMEKKSIKCVHKIIFLYRREVLQTDFALWFILQRMSRSCCFDKQEEQMTQDGKILIIIRHDQGWVKLPKEVISQKEKLIRLTL